MPVIERKRSGRPRSEAAHKAILKAARALLEEGGIPAVTIEAIAQRAKVGKPTIYRYWRNRYEVAMAALMMEASRTVPSTTDEPPLTALMRQLHDMARMFQSGVGRSVTLLLMSGEGETDLSRAFRYWFIDARRQEAAALLERAIEDRRLRPDTNVAVTLDLIYGSILYRLALAREPMDAAFMDALLATVLEGISLPKIGLLLAP